MFCENCGRELTNDSLFCPACGSAVTEPTNTKKTKKRWIAVISIALSVALVLGGVFAWLFVKDDAIERLSSAMLKTFEAPVKITATGLSDVNAELFDSETVELIIPEALANGHYAMSVGSLVFYHKADYAYYELGTDMGMFCKATPESEELTGDLNISKYFDYLVHIANGDYDALSELFNGESQTGDDILSKARVLKRLYDIVDTYFSDEYMAEHYGFVYTEADGFEKYTFSLSYATIVQTIYEIIEGSKECFSNVDDYNELINDIGNLRNDGLVEKILFDIEIVLKDGVFDSIDIGASNEGEALRIALDFSDYGTATVSDELRAAYDKRKEQLNGRDYVIWYGSMEYSDYYEKD